MQTYHVTVASPRHAEHRPHGAAAVVVGILSCLLSLAVNFLLFMFAVFSSTISEAVAYITIMVGELAVAAAFAVWFARRRDSTVSLAFCAGVAGGVTPFLLWLTVGVLATL